ncbi:MAG: FHA domain-containing protein, partial [Verrucomicrobiaceae bacterium]|nr:FHA domain-containing protein [Verrucomicrobiaceae bacterium]
MHTAELRFKIADKQVLPFRLSDKITTLGKYPENSIVIDNATISSFHAEIHFKDSIKGYEIINMGSEGTTRVNGAKIMRQDLENGDIIHFGQVEAELIIQSARQNADPERFATPNKTSVTTSARSATPTPGRVLVKSMPREHEQEVNEEPSTTGSVPPHKIKKANTRPVKTQANQAGQKTKLNIQVKQADKLQKTRQKNLAPHQKSTQGKKQRQFKSKSEAAEDKLKKLKKEYKSIKQEVEGLQAKIQKRKERLVGLDATKEALEKTERKLTSAKEKAKSAAKKHSAIKITLQQSQEEKKSLKDELKQLTAARDALKGERNTLQNDKNEAQSSTAKLKKINLRLEAEQSKITAANKLLKGESRKFTQKRRTAEDKLNHLEAERTRLNQGNKSSADKLEKLNASLATGRVANTEAKKELTNTEKQNAEATAQLAGLKKEVAAQARKETQAKT